MAPLKIVTAEPELKIIQPGGVMTSDPGSQLSNGCVCVCVCVCVTHAPYKVGTFQLVLRTSTVCLQTCGQVGLRKGQGSGVSWAYVGP